jgi:hypothetical protein
MNPEESPNLELPQTFDATPDPERIAMARELGALVESAIDRLPDGTREVFMLRQVEGMSTDEVADALNISEAVVKTRLWRARGAVISSSVQTVSPATALSVGLKVASLAPGLPPELKTEFSMWGPGMYDPRHHAFNGTTFIGLNSPSVPVVLPPTYGLRGVGFDTYTADGPISYWNSYVGVGQMGGQGSFSDPRIGLFISQTPDLVTPKLRALREYQLGLRAPDPPADSFRPRAAARGRRLFYGQAGCGTCHSGPKHTDVLSGRPGEIPVVHDANETGMDPVYASRSATGGYRATPLRALWQHAPYFHDGSAPDLAAVVEHYNGRGLGLTDRQKADLVEFLKSL